MRGATNVFDELPEALREALKRRGIEKPTPIQEKAIPVIRRGFNTLIMAPTGSGKTEAALLPVASQIIEKSLYGELRVLYVTPLRALNRDIGLRAFELLKEVGIEVDVWHGDTPQSKRRKILAKPPEVLVTTPESLNILLVNKKMRERLRNVKFVIVDELHEVIEDKRGVELSVALERLSLLSSFQRLGISATISQIDLAKKFLGSGRYVVEVRDEREKRPEISVFVEENFEEMVNRLRNLVIGTDGTVLIFTNTRDTAEVLGKRLREEFDGVAVHHGSLSKKEREEAEKSAREGKLKALVATSSLELGIDIGQIKYVIQFTSPRRATNLVQRIGRAEHKPNERPKGALVTGLKPYEAFEAVVIARRAQSGNLEKLSVHLNPLDVLAHQIVGILMEEPRSKDEVYDIVRRAFPYWNLSRRDFEETVDLLLESRLIECDPEGKCKARKKGEIYYRTTGPIVESKRYKALVYGTNHFVGTLDEEFVVELNVGDRFVLGGKVWKVVGIEGEVVYVEESSGEGPPPCWEGELIPVEYEIAREVGALKRNFDKMISSYPLTRESVQRLRSYLNEINAPIATDKRIVIEVEGNLIVYNVHGGSKVNLALAYALSELARLRYGSASFNTTPYHVMIFVNSRVTPYEAKDLLLSLKNFDIEELVLSAVKTSKLFSWRLMKVLVRMGLLNRNTVSLDELRKVEKSLRRTYLNEVPGREAIREILTEKIDLEKAKELVSELDSYEIVTKVGLSAQSRWAVEGQAYAKDHVSDTKSVVKEAVKLRLQKKDVEMYCLLCGRKWEGKVADVPLTCPSCGAKVVIPVFRPEEELRAAVTKFTRGERLKRDERKLMEEARKRANLVALYGRNALMALAGRGIGATTASKVLERWVTGREDLIDAIIKAEKVYLKTKRFW
ncbi:DEAD/DEAH box helicase [Ignicoccus islandicus]|nr:DEAD/DEAH box helicase [Ignicoccus islandicus]